MKGWREEENSEAEKLERGGEGKRSENKLRWR